MKRRALLKAAMIAPFATQLMWIARHLPGPTGARLYDFVHITLQNRSEEIARNISSHNALLNKLEKN